MFNEQRSRGRHGDPRWHGPGEPGPGRGRGRGRLMHEVLFGHFPPRGPMARRGDVRSAILALLAEKPMHGYQIMGELANRSQGMWRPSAGSIYPTLQQMEDEGLVHSDESEGRRVFALTDAGRAAVAARHGRSGAPWESMGEGQDAAVEIRDLSFQVGAAAMQVLHVGPPDGVAQTRAILIEARRRLYRLLAEDEASPAPTDGASHQGPPA